MEAGLSPEDAFDTYASISVHTQGAAVLERLQDRSGGAEPYRRSGTSVIDPETMPLISGILTSVITQPDLNRGAASKNTVPES